VVVRSLREAVASIASELVAERAPVQVR